MRKALIVLSLAVALVFAFSAVAYADHAPSNYLEWDGSGINSNGPHTDYQLNTKKCNVCHSVHRAAVPGESITNLGGSTPILTADDADTQMLLRSSVAASCNYCHMDTAVGGIRLWNGNSANWGDASGAVWVNEGFGHNATGCTSCHAVHGAKTFKGAAASKILRYDIKAAVLTGTTDVADHSYNDPALGAMLTGVQDEIFEAGGAGGTASVQAGSLPLFASLDDTIEGGAVEAWSDASVKDAQVSAFCTCCHANYSSASEVIVNIDEDMALFGGTYSWVDATVGSFTYTTFNYKNHPVGPATNTFAAAGDTTSATTVAWATASSCRACHDAGVVDAPAGVVLNSYPHITPGYYRFMGAGVDETAYDTASLDTQTYADLAYLDTPTQEGGSYALLGDLGAMQFNGAVDGHCLKCHVSGSGAGAEGVGLTY